MPANPFYKTESRPVVLGCMAMRGGSFRLAADGLAQPEMGSSFKFEEAPLPIFYLKDIDGAYGTATRQVMQPIQQKVADRNFVARGKAHIVDLVDANAAKRENSKQAGNDVFAA